MTMSTDQEQTAAQDEPTGRVGSLRFRLVSCLVAIVWVGMGVSLAAGYFLEYRSRKRALLASLTEQAHSLLVAREKIRQPSEYAAFVDEFCARMNAEISRGHHILIYRALPD